MWTWESGVLLYWAWPNYPGFKSLRHKALLWDNCLLDWEAAALWTTNTGHGPFVMNGMRDQLRCPFLCDRKGSAEQTRAACSLQQWCRGSSWQPWDPFYSAPLKSITEHFFSLTNCPSEGHAVRNSPVHRSRRVLNKADDLFPNGNGFCL